MAIYKAVVSITHGSLGGAGSNTWHIRADSTGPLDFSDADDTFDLVKNFYNAINAIYPAGGSLKFDGLFTGVGASEGEVVNGTPWTITTSDLSGQTLPPATCLVVGWRTSTGGRSGKGRTFLGPVAQNTNDSAGTPGAGTLGTVRDAALALVTASEASENGAVGVYSPQDSLLRDFTGVQVRDQYAVLRSRRD